MGALIRLLSLCWATPDHHVPVHQHWRPLFFPPGTLNFLPAANSRSVALLHASHPWAGSSRPKWGLSRKWLRSQKAEGPLARTQISHKIWILTYQKWKFQQQNINKARENRMCLFSEKNAPVLTVGTVTPQQLCSWVLRWNLRKTGEMATTVPSLGGGEQKGFLQTTPKLIPMATEITNMKTMR